MTSDTEDADEADEQPDLDDEDYVDVPEDMAAEVAAGDDTDDQEADESEESADDGDEVPDATETLTSGTSVGDVYCNALGMTATLARDSKGSGVADRERQTEEYADMARQLDLDDFVNEWVEAHGGADELSPGQGIVLGTSMFAIAVLVEDPDLAEGLSEEVNG